MSGRVPATLGPTLLALLGLIVALLPGVTPATAAGPCDPPLTNPVACENTKPGNPKSEWDVSGAGSSNIQGYATDISVNVGGTVQFKVSSNASFRADIYRLGYYGGAGARKVGSVTGSAVSQPSCRSDGTTGLVDCGNWSVNASWPVPAESVSGIYFAKLVRTSGSTGSSHVVFVVRDDASTSPLLFQTSDTTWQAYNQYGGNSLYVGSPAGRAYKVSYNRPFTTRGTSPEDWVFNAEYPMVRWLEANGYHVSYTTGVDSDRRGGLIKNHRAFLSVGHDEYWSAGQRRNVEAARDAGVHMAFFSGNEVFWKTRWESSIDGSGTPYRTLVSYKETLADAEIDPSPEWTGTWRDPRFPTGEDRRPENALTGQIFYANCCTHAIKVPEVDGKMRFWRGTAVANQAAGATHTLPHGTLGYEWDADEDNGHRPPGVVRMSSTTETVDKLQDYGKTYASGSVTHNLTLYKASSGALVFGAGTVQWSWGLDSNHDRGSEAPSPAMQQATVNLLADMGIQPDTLQAGLVKAAASTDTTPPVSTVTSPAAGSSVSPGATVTVTGTATDTGGRVGGVEVSTDGSTWHPATGRGSWTYSFRAPQSGTLTVRTRAVDDSGNLETPGTGTSLTVGSGSTACPCTIFGNATPSVLADPDTSSIELGVKFSPSVSGSITGIRFHKSSENTGTHVGRLWSSAGSLLASVTFTGETASGWQSASFSQPVAVTAGTTYVASYSAPGGRYSVDEGYFAAAATNGPLTAPASGTSGGNGVYGSAGAFPTSTYNASNYWVDVVFTDGATTDTTAPTLTSQSPAPGATGVATTAKVSGTFSEPVSGAAVTVTAAGSPVPGTTTYDSGTNTVTFTPGQALPTDTTVAVTVSGAKDAAGNVMSSVSWSFTTAAPASCPCSLFSSDAVPRVLADNGTRAVELGVKFVPSVSGTITGVRFYKAATNTGTHVGRIWSSSGTQLGSVTFTNETASGWQTATFAQPVAVTAGTTYVASYFAPVGRYSFDENYFGNALTAGPLTAPSSGSSGGNGVYVYSSTGGFPTRTYKASNYWVDVVFTPTTTSDTTPPTVTAQSPSPGATGVSTGTTASARFSEPVEAATVTVTPQGGTAVTGSTAYDASTLTVTFTPSSPLAAGTTHSVVVSGARDAAGNTMSPVSWSFSTATADTTAPVVTSRSPLSGETGVATTTSVSATFSEPVTGVVVTLASPDGSMVSGTSAYDATTRTASFQPAAALAAGTTYTATVRDARDAAGNVMSPVSWSFTTAAASTCPCSLWSTSDTPTIVADPDTSPVELGVKFTASTSGTITGIRFYKSTGNTGTHVGRIWSNSGTELAAVTFTGETASGWQTATFSNPVPITAGTTYVASYYAPAGRYSVDENYFASARSNGPLTAPASGSSGGNGVYRYATGGGFPNSSYAASNYWVDVVFTPNVQ